MEEKPKSEAADAERRLRAHRRHLSDRARQAFERATDPMPAKGTEQSADDYASKMEQRLTELANVVGVDAALWGSRRADTEEFKVAQKMLEDTSVPIADVAVFVLREYAKDRDQRMHAMMDELDQVVGGRMPDMAAAVAAGERAAGRDAGDPPWLADLTIAAAFGLGTTVMALGAMKAGEILGRIASKATDGLNVTDVLRQLAKLTQAKSVAMDAEKKVGVAS